MRKRSSTGAELDLSSTGVPLNEDLERFARNREDPHLEAWRRFNKTIGSDGSVGIWHETYQVSMKRSTTICQSLASPPPPTTSQSQNVAKPHAAA